ncbi:MAG: glycosyltransferase family 2 protein [Haliea sp.]|nr:glycosyltransferase family 2 protein [Haliea sp.]
MSTQLVSILIPTYNQAGYLKQAVESALNQEYPHLEVIICDDASLDWDPDLLAEFAADPRLRIHRNQINLWPGRQLQARAL